MNVVGRSSKELSNPDKTHTNESSRGVELQLVAAVPANALSLRERACF
jgi:hypothetical protein